MRLATVTIDRTRITHSTAAMRLVNAPIMNEHDALGPLHEPDLALLDQRLGACARVAGHDREDHRQRRDHHVVGAPQVGVEIDQAEEQREVGEAVERRVPERAELRTACW